MKINIDVTPDGKKITLSSEGRIENFEEHRERCKAINGARWQPKDRVWAYPADVFACTELRRIWGSDLVISPALNAWYRNAKAATDAAQTLTSAADAELARVPMVAPKLAATLRPDQRAGAAWMAHGYRGAGLVAPHPGTGKTLVVIAGLIEAGVTGPIIIMCPKVSVRTVWQRAYERWTDIPCHIARGTRAQRERAIAAFQADPAVTKVLVVVMEMLRVKNAPEAGHGWTTKATEYPALFETQWSAQVVDESHKAFGSMTVAKGTLASQGLMKLPLAPGGRRYAVTATPYGRGGRVQGLFGTLRWLWPTEFTSYWKWVERWFEVEQNEVWTGRSRGMVTTRTVGKLKNGLEEEAFLTGLGPRIFRRRKEEVLRDLPPKNYVEVLCEPTAAQAKQLQSLVNDAEFAAGEGVVTADGVLALMVRGKQLADGALRVGELGEVKFDPANSGKIDMLLQVLEENGDAKAVIASQFNEFLVAVMARLEPVYGGLGEGYYYIDGGVSDRAREAAQEAFQRNEHGPRLMVINSKVGGVSIDLDAADHMHILDELWNPEDNEQLEDRIHRASRNHQVTIYQYRTEGTIDEHIRDEVEDKRLAQFQVLDGARGLTYAREMVRYTPPAKVAP